MSQKTYYKIVRNENGTYKSIFAPENASVTYAIGQKTVPKQGAGPLTIFESLSHLKFFFIDFNLDLRINYSYFILECYIEPYEKKPETIERYVLWNPRKNSFLRETDLPIGTVLCKSITPIEKIGLLEHVNCYWLVLDITG